MILSSHLFSLTGAVKYIKPFLDNKSNILLIWGLIKARYNEFKYQRTYCCQVPTYHHEDQVTNLFPEFLRLKTMDPNYHGYSQSSQTNMQQAFNGYGQYSNSSSIASLTNHISALHLDASNASQSQAAASISPQYLYNINSPIDPNLIFASQQLRSVLLRPVQVNPSVPPPPSLLSITPAFAPQRADARTEYSRNQLLNLAPTPHQPYHLLPNPGYHLLPNPLQPTYSIPSPDPRANQFLTPYDIRVMQTAQQTRSYSTYGGYSSGAAPAFQRNMHNSNSPRAQRAGQQTQQNRPRRPNAGSGPSILQQPRPVFNTYSQLREYCQTGSVSASSSTQSPQKPPSRLVAPPGVDIVHVWADLTREGRLGTRTPLAPLEPSPTPDAASSASNSASTSNPTPNPPKSARVEAANVKEKDDDDEDTEESQAPRFEFTLMTWNTLSPALAQGHIHLYDRYCEHEWLDYKNRAPLLIERMRRVNADVRAVLIHFTSLHFSSLECYIGLGFGSGASQLQLMIKVR